MKDKYLVRECLEALQNSKLKVSMKCRIGLGKELNYEFFEEFIDEVIKSEINLIYVHARNAILSGISPKANRSIPLLDYSFVKKIKIKYPNIKFILNGGIDTISKAKNLSLEHDGVMLGRLIQNNPFVLKDVDHLFFDQNKNENISEKIITDYFDYIKKKIDMESIYRLLSPILQIFFSVPNSRTFKIKVHEKIKESNLTSIENIFLDFIKEKRAYLN